MSIEDLLQLLLLLAVIYGVVLLVSIKTLLERVASVSHYQQNTAFDPGVKTSKVKSAKPEEKTGHKPTDGLVDITDLPEETAIQALENWKP